MSKVGAYRTFLLILTCAVTTNANRIVAAETNFGENPQYVASLERDCAHGNTKILQGYIGNFVIACHNLGALRFRQQKFPAALKAFSQSLALEPQYAPEWCNRGDVYLSISKHAEALKDYDKCIQVGPKLARAYPQRARIFAKTNDLKSAIQEIDKYIALKPNDPTGYVLRSSLYEKIGKNESAISDYEKAVQLDPNIKRLNSKPCGNCSL